MMSDPRQEPICVPRSRPESDWDRKRGLARKNEFLGPTWEPMKDCHLRRATKIYGNCQSQGYHIWDSRPSQMARPGILPEQTRRTLPASARQMRLARATDTHYKYRVDAYDAQRCPGRIYRCPCQTGSLAFTLPPRCQLTYASKANAVGKICPSSNIW